ncbi:protein of unassigned function [Methylobacterium oryzae CBMB20]|uniref:Protein of unassigned function n=1 Tax=Methylobacterium oryzae CBMB20 TaxID=693986 RepID=A0A089NZ82_9HYPH|nr:protein of unassigned function [Methylobacterium oryzae CBMB20]
MGCTTRARAGPTGAGCRIRRSCDPRLTRSQYPIIKFSGRWADILSVRHRNLGVNRKFLVGLYTTGEIERRMIVVSRRREGAARLGNPAERLGSKTFAR